MTIHHLVAEFFVSLARGSGFYNSNDDERLCFVFHFPTRKDALLYIYATSVIHLNYSVCLFSFQIYMQISLIFKKKQMVLTPLFNDDQ